MPKTIKSIDKAIKVLNCFFEKEELGINEIVELTDLNKSTVYDLINTLEANNMVYQNIDNNRYRLGIKMLEFGRLYEIQNPISEVAQKYGKLLAEENKATVHLATYHDDQVIYLNKYESPQAPVSYSRVGKSAPMTCTGLGKAILAFLPKKYMEEYITVKELPAFNSNSITSVEELERELKITKQRGYAVDNEEIELGIRCVAAPIFSKNKVIGAMSISMLAPYITTATIPTLAKEIIDVTSKISKSM